MTKEEELDFAWRLAKSFHEQLSHFRPVITVIQTDKDCFHLESTLPVMIKTKSPAAFVNGINVTLGS